MEQLMGTVMFMIDKVAHAKLSECIIHNNTRFVERRGAIASEAGETQKVELVGHEDEIK